MVYSRQERDYWTSPPLSRSVASFLESPAWVMELTGWSEPRYYFAANPMAKTFWESNYSAPDQEAVKPMFYEIFTNSKGPLTSGEVEKEIERLDLRIDQSHAARTYNEKLDKDHQLYGEDLDFEEIRGRIASASFDRLVQVHEWVSLMLEAEPLYFSFKTVEPSAAPFKTNAPHVETGLGELSIAIAFPGSHALARDAFSPGTGRNELAGIPEIKRPGRDRWARAIGTDAFDNYLYSPAHVLTSIQIEQLEEGRAVTMPRSLIIPAELLRG